MKRLKKLINVIAACSINVIDFMLFRKANVGF